MLIVLSRRFFGLKVTFGKQEQANFKAQRGEFASNAVDVYDAANGSLLTCKRLFLPAS